jgi:peptide/nickel transport system permease protein
MRMWVYIVRRLMLLIPIIIGVMTITFILVNALPPADQMEARFGCTPHACNYSPGTALYNRSAALLGLNQPVFVRWGIYMENSLSFNWGSVSAHSSVGKSVIGSTLIGVPVTTVFADLLPYTIELAALSLIIILIISIPIGNLSAVYRNRPIDQASRVMSFSGYALPAFLLGSLVLIGIVLVIGSATGYQTVSPWCPSGETTYLEFFGSWPTSTCFTGAAYPAWLGASAVHSTPTGFPTLDALIHGDYWLALDTIIRMILPALVIAFGTIATLLRFVRNSMLEVMNLDFVRTARAKGVPESTVISRHAGRNSLNVTITVLGLTFAFFLGGFPIIETVFNLNGVGYILAIAVDNVQYPFDFAIIFGSVLLFTYLVVFANLIVDVLYAYLDPRVRLG